MEQFIAPENINFLIESVLIYIFIAWIAITVWVVKDITHRTNSLFFQTLSSIGVFLTLPIGIFIYLILRPQKTLFETFLEQQYQLLQTQINTKDKTKSLPKKTLKTTNKKTKTQAKKKKSV